MVAYDLPVAEVVKLLDKAVVKTFKIGIVDQCEFNGREARELILQRALVGFNDRDGSIPFVIVGAVKSRWKGNEALAFEG